MQWQGRRRELDVRRREVKGKHLKTRVEVKATRSIGPRSVTDLVGRQGRPIIKGVVPVFIPLPLGESKQKVTRNRSFGE